MSKNKMTASPESANDRPPAAQADEIPLVHKTKVVAAYEQCPLCWGVHKGTGRNNGVHGHATYFACRNCGWTWKKVFSTVEDARQAGEDAGSA